MSDWYKEAMQKQFAELGKGPIDEPPTPELPEEYREDEDGSLWFGTVCLAVVDKRGRLMTSVLEHEFPVLAIWLQRRAK